MYTGWLTDWLTSWSTADWFVDLLVGYSVDLSDAKVSGQIIAWLSVWLVDSKLSFLFKSFLTCMLVDSAQAEQLPTSIFFVFRFVLTPIGNFLHMTPIGNTFIETTI